MLEKLEMINWSSLTHAYGSATDVPDLLRGLASRKVRERENALQALHSTIWHQGTVYEATSFAVPFICELLRSPTVQGKASLLHLIQAISSAHPRSDSQPDPLWREKPSPMDLIHYPENSKWARQASQTVSTYLNTFITLLEDASPLVRGTAAFTISYCASPFSEIDLPLRRRIDKETHSWVKAALIHVWTTLWEKRTHNPKVMKDLLRHFVHNTQEKPLVRLMAALGLSQFLREGHHPKLTRFLAWAFRRSGKAVAGLSRFDPSFNLQQALVNRHEMRLELCLALATKPSRSLKEHILFDLEHLCRERRRNFVRVIPVLGQLLSDGDPVFRANVAMSLSQMGTRVRFAQEPLVLALQDPNPDVALWSAVALSKLRDPRVLPFLFTNLAPERHTDFAGSQSTETMPVPELVRMQQAVSKHLKSLRMLLDALKPFGTLASAVLPHLRNLLSKRGRDIQKMVCSNLAFIGEPAADTVPAVAKLLRFPETQSEAAWALMHWGLIAEKSIPELIQFLEDFPQANTWARAFAIQALGKMGDLAQDALPVLTKTLYESECVTKCEAALAVWRIAPQTPHAIEVLIKELKERTKPGWATYGCVHVVRALETIGPQAKPAEALLQKLLGDPEAWSRVHAARALWKIGASLAVFMPVLIDDLLCRPVGIATGLLAAECLAEIGPPASAALPRLNELSAREDSFAHYGTDWAETDEAFQNAMALAKRSITADGSDWQQDRKT